MCVLPPRTTLLRGVGPRQSRAAVDRGQCRFEVSVDGLAALLISPIRPRKRCDCVSIVVIAATVRLSTPEPSSTLEVRAAGTLGERVWTNAFENFTSRDRPDCGDPACPRDGRVWWRLRVRSRRRCPAVRVDRAFDDTRRRAGTRRFLAPGPDLCRDACRIRESRARGVPARLAAGKLLRRAAWAEE